MKKIVACLLLFVVSVLLADGPFGVLVGASLQLKAKLTSQAQSSE